MYMQHSTLWFIFATVGRFIKLKTLSGATEIQEKEFIATLGFVTDVESVFLL
jgi:hypothetical protein